MKIIIKFIFILLLLAPILAQSQVAKDFPQNNNATKDVGIKKTSESKKQKTSDTHKKITNLAINKLKTEVPAKNCAYKARPEQTKSKPAWHVWIEPISILTCCLVLVTIGLFVATMKIVKVTRQTAKRQLRAYVSARLADGEKIFLDENNCLSVPLIIENHGQTPAHKLRKSAFVNIFKNPLQDVLDPPEYNGGSVTCLAPGQKSRMYPTLPRALNGSEIISIKNKEGCFCVWGYLEYVDIFNNHQTTEFRMYSTGNDLERGELAYCEKGNNAT
jgi:hypothetical protein